jgi:hypothetical protein
MREASMLVALSSGRGLLLVRIFTVLALSCGEVLSTSLAIVAASRCYMVCF